MSDSLIPNLFPDAFDLAVLGICLLILAVPGRYLPHVIGWLAIPVVLVMVELGHPPHWQQQGIGYAIALGWLISAGLLIGGVILVKSVGIAAWAKWRRRPVFSREGWEPGRVFAVLQKALYLCWGVLAACLFILFLRKLFQGMSPAWLAHAFAFAIAGLMWAVPRPAVPETVPRRHQLDRRAWRLFISSSRWSVAGLLAVTAVAPIHVGASAAEVAAGDPYCIQVAERSRGHRPARAVLDLSFLTMKAARMHGEQQHALLIVESGDAVRLYNWSYRQLGFVDEAGNGDYPRHWPALTCAPRQDFAENLPYVLPAAEDTRTVRIHDRTFRIPAVYRPRAHGNWYPYVRLYMEPRFAWDQDEPANPQGWFGSPVTVYPDRWQNSHRDFATPDASPADSATSAHDLARTTGSYQWRGQTVETTSYTDRDEAGVLRVSIECNALRFPEPFSCEHRFVHDGMLFRFRQRPEDLPAWPRIQDWLISTLDAADTGRPGP